MMGEDETGAGLSRFTSTIFSVMVSCVFKIICFDPFVNRQLKYDSAQSKTRLHCTPKF